MSSKLSPNGIEDEAIQTEIDSDSWYRIHTQDIRTVMINCYAEYTLCIGHAVTVSNRVVHRGRAAYSAQIHQRRQSTRQFGVYLLTKV
jgi:hypothetical protein